VIEILCYHFLTAFLKSIDFATCVRISDTNPVAPERPKKYKFGLTLLVKVVCL